MADEADDDSIVGKIKHFLGTDKPSRLTHGGKTYDEIVDEAESGHSSITPSNAGPGSQNTDAWNKY